MIFGHTIDFVDDPVLNSHFQNRENSFVRGTIKVQECSLPHFEVISASMPHSLQKVRYGTHTSFEETKGKNAVWMMEIIGVLKLVWFPAIDTIGYEKGSGFSSQRLRFWVYHTFLPLLLQMEGIYNILHAGCVEVEGKAIVFIAPSFGGKSTLTDLFLQQGHRLLSDDTLAVDTMKNGEYRAIASWPFHRPFREPEILGKETEAFVTKPLEIAAVYRLSKTEAHAKVAIEEMRGIEKFRQIHYSSFIPLNFLKKRIFAFHTDFAHNIPLYRLSIPWEKRRLNDVYQTVLQQRLQM